MFTVESEFQIGAKRMPNEEIADAARENSDMMLAYALYEVIAEHRLRNAVSAYDTCARRSLSSELLVTIIRASLSSRSSDCHACRALCIGALCSILFSSLTMSSGALSGVQGALQTDQNLCRYRVVSAHF